MLDKVLMHEGKSTGFGRLEDAVLARQGTEA